MIKKKQFKDIGVGQIFYAIDEDNSTLCKCIKCEHFDPDVYETMDKKNEWVDAIVNAAWLESHEGYKAGTLDWFPDTIMVWVDETN